ncbi:phage tail protein [Rhizobium cremeum]|uniref:phage tail protein n=1 Tax=Rhizobium cremeum TaxID=2813827 RepID=UPI001FD23290|nr:phage tail protein [Rhizobium cremeum]MCJ7996061.1 phage tail protein [Rhizobium cremeum]MCJ8001320.1 phage tail protein [Rhizobium cremeum]
MIYLLGSIPLGIAPLTGPTAHDFSYANTFAQHATTRGKPALQEIGEELDARNITFFFSEEFCTPATELAKLKAAFLLKTPLPLVLGTGEYDGKRYVVETMSGAILKTNKSGAVVRVEATIGLLEDPVVGGVASLISSLAKTRAAGLSGNSSSNPEVRK